jgi:hypothetical protein
MKMGTSVLMSYLRVTLGMISSSRGLDDLDGK